MDSSFHAGTVVADPGVQHVPASRAARLTLYSNAIPAAADSIWDMSVQFSVGGGHSAARPDLGLAVANAAGRLWDNRIANGFAMMGFKGSRSVLLIGVLMMGLLGGCVEKPEAKLEGHLNTQGLAKRIGIVSALGDTLTFTRSNGFTTSQSFGDIRGWNVDQYVLDTATHLLAAGLVVQNIRAESGALDSVAATTLVTPTESISCRGAPTIWPLLDSKASACTLYRDSPELVSHQDAAALSHALHGLLAAHAGEADVWLVFRKGAGADEASEQGIAQMLHAPSGFHRIGISIAKFPGTKLLGTGGIELQVLGRVTIVDGATLEPIADAPLTIISPKNAFNFNRTTDVVPFWYLRDEFEVSGWGAYTPQQQEQIHVTLKSLLNNAITQTLTNIGLLSVPS